MDLRENFPPRYNIAPTQPIVAIIAAAKGRGFNLMRWGFAPSWAKDDYLERLMKRPLINARSETVGEKATFRNAWRRRRCLIPADGFYEWRGAKGAKQPFAFFSEEMFAFGGVWETAVDADGGEIDTAAILTTASGDDVAPYHDREPVVVHRADYERWLATDETTPSDLLRPAKKGFWTIRAVSKKVNSVRNDGPELLSSAAQGV